MPVTTHEIKVRAVRALGAEVVLHGDTYDEAWQEALRLADEIGAAFVHPYDDPEVIAGQGTIAVEICRQHPDPIDAVFVPVGGGGLIAGILAYLKFIRPETAIIGVESDVLFPVWQQRELAEWLKKGGCPTTYLELDAPYGHDTFLIEPGGKGRCAKFTD